MMNKEPPVTEDNKDDMLEKIEEDFRQIEESLEQKINRETARIQWNEIEPHFAAGNVISVAKELDLIHVARAMSDDDTASIKQWMDDQQVMPTSSEQAVEWQACNAELWAVVIKPWILVQATTETQ
jgi:hypothetical protein